MILVSFFSEDNVLSEEINIFECQSNENRAFPFFGTPGVVPNVSEFNNELTRIVIAHDMTRQLN